MKKLILAALIVLSANAFAQQSYQRYGNTVYGSDGRSYQQHGNTTYGSDGSTYQRHGNTTYRNYHTKFRAINSI